MSNFENPKILLPKKGHYLNVTGFLFFIGNKNIMLSVDDDILKIYTIFKIWCGGVAE